MTSPAAQRRPPLLHSPFVPSIMRCDSAEDEDKRQRAAARCALQQANIALFVCAVILKRIIVWKPCHVHRLRGMKRKQNRRKSGATLV